MQGNGPVLAAAGGQADIELDGYPTLFRDLFVTFRSRGVSREESQDLAQETILRTLVHLRRHGKASDDLGPLVRTIGRNLFIERVRRARPEIVELSDTIVDDSPEPHEVVLESEQREQVQIALRSLAPRHRHVVQLWMQGLTPGQIARELGIKRNAADAILHRARRRLASVLESNRGAFGTFAIAISRLRFGMRRLADTLFRIDPSGAVGTVVTGLAAAGVAVAIAATSAAPIQIVHSVPSAGHVRQTASTVTGLRSPNRSGIGRTHFDASSAALPEREVGAGTSFTNPATGREEDPNVSITYQPDGQSGPLDQSSGVSFDTVCASLPSFCGP